MTCRIERPNPDRGAALPIDAYSLPATCGAGPVVTGLALQTARLTNTATPRIIVSLARAISMPGWPGFAAHRTLRPFSTAIRRTRVAAGTVRPHRNEAAADRRPVGEDASEFARREQRQRVVAISSTLWSTSLPRCCPDCSQIFPSHPPKYRHSGGTVR